MKKIVALVLAMVMVLGLATTAFAATAGESLEEALSPANGYTAEIKAGLDASASLKTFQTYQVFLTKTADKSVTVLADQYVKVPTDVNADVFVVDGKNITYLMVNPGAYTDTAKAVKVAYNAKPVCGDVYVEDKADADTYYLYKGAYYAEATEGVVFNVDGMAVVATATDLVKTAKHDYDWDLQIVNGEAEVTKVSCTVCKKSFVFVEGTEADAVAKFGAGNYEAVIAGELYVLKAAAAGSAAEDTTVESPKTFDAGIAMYVGMSVMAAAGSAVVLKKKD